MKDEILKHCLYYDGTDNPPKTDPDVIFWNWEREYAEQRYEKQHEHWEEYADKDFAVQFPDWAYIIEGRAKAARGMLAFAILNMTYHAPQSAEYLIDKYGHDYGTKAK